MAEPLAPGRPLTPAQHDIWLSHELDPTGTAYTVVETFRVDGPLDVEALRLAFADVVSRHAALRTHFYDTLAGPRQSVIDTAAPPLVVLAAGAAPPVVPRIDLAGGAPVAAHLCTEGADRHRLVLAAHHLVLDGPSLRILFADLGAAYHARRAGAVPDRTPATRFLAYAEDLASRPAPDAGYWRERLRDVAPIVDLPHDRAGEAGAGNPVAGVCDFVVEPAVTDAVRRLAREAGSSAFCVLAAALAVLIGRVSGADDVPLGLAVSGRRPGRDDATVGCFAGTVVLRVTVPAEMPFARLLDTVTDDVFEAVQHQGVSLRDVAAASDRYHPLLRVLLAYNAEPPRLVLAGTRCRRLPRVHGAPKAELTFNLEGGDGRAPITGQLVYDRGRLSTGAAVELVGCYRRLVAAFAAAPSTALRVPPLVDPHAVAPAVRAEPEPVDVVRAVLERARTEPAAVAATDGGGAVLRYGDLARRATAYAAGLRTLGVRDGLVCAIALPASPDVLVAIFATWLAGAALVIVDPGLPAERRRRLLERSGARLVLAGAGGPDGDHGVPRTDERAATVAGLATGPENNAAPPAYAAPPAGTAYAVTTSGSTGEPKLVLVGHRALGAYLRHAADCYGTALTGTALLHSPLSFDMSMTALLAPLVAGGTVRFGPLPATGPTPAMIKLTPSHLRMLELLDETAAPAELLVVAGEALDGDLIQRWRARNPGLAVCNAYGPCEATVTSFQQVIPPDAAVPPGPVPIGRPFGATRGYVLDGELRPQPPGVAGELYLAGPQLAYGYLDDPALTAERFLPDPFGPPGARMYRTGDRVRRCASGELVFVGRTDDQLSVRGHRVEPAEVEEVGRRCPGVTGFAVTLDAEAQTLLAFATVRDGGPTPAAIRARLAAELPAHLVPGAVEIVPRLPTTRHGKLDRAALATLRRPSQPTPATGAAPKATGIAVVGPEAPPGVALVCAAFAEVLDVPAVDTWDNFFALGGHSLLAARLVSRLRERLGVRLSLLDVVAAPTPGALAAKLAEQPTDPGLDVVLGLRPGGTGTPLVCLPPITGVGWCYTGLLALVGEEHPIHALQSTAVLSGPTPPRTVAELAEIFTHLVADLCGGTPPHLLGWSFGGLLAHEVCRRMQIHGLSVSGLSLLDSHLPDTDRATSQDELADAGARRRYLERAGLRIDDLDPATVDRILHAVRSHLAMQALHRPGVVRGRVDFFRAEHGDLARADAARRWRPFVQGDLVEHRVPATHHGIVRHAALARVMRVVRRALASDPALAG